MSTEKLKEESKKLAGEFRELIAVHNDTERAVISDKLMSLIRRSTIYIPKKKAEEYNGSSVVTIDPSKVKLSHELNDAERESYYRIRAYSFGPFNPVEYFKCNYKILWILKEPLCMSISEIDGSEIKDYNQAKQYSTFEKVKDEDFDTIKNSITYSQILLKTLGIDYSDNSESEEEEMNQVMNHICILEINHFPGLAFNSKKTNNPLLKNWYEINQPILKELITFYNADIIVMGGVHKCIHSCKSSYADKIIENIQDQTGKLFYGLGYTPHEDCAKNGYISGISNYIIPTKDDGPIFIQADHPSSWGFIDNAKDDGSKILKWKEEHKK